MSKIKLTSWYEIDEQEYMLYILKGYEIVIDYDEMFIEWYLNDELHRENYPAYIDVSGYKAWYRNGKRHREDGPAIIREDGSQRWFLLNIEYDTEEEYRWEVKKYVNN